MAIARRLALAGLAAGVLAQTGCATLQELAALRHVQFSLDRIADVRVAGVALKPGLRYSDLGITDAARIAQAVRAHEMPIEMTVHVRAENPAGNRVTARLVDLDWALLVEDRETLAGTVEGDHAMAPGAPVDVPIGVRFDLLVLGDRGPRDLFDLAIGIAGLGGTPREVELRLQPTVETGLGPIPYPHPVVIRKAVGSG